MWCGVGVGVGVGVPRGFDLFFKSKYNIKL